MFTVKHKMYYRSTALLACSLVPLILMTAFIRVGSLYASHWLSEQSCIEWPWFHCFWSYWKDFLLVGFPSSPTVAELTQAKSSPFHILLLFVLLKVLISRLATAWGWLAVVWSVPPHVPLCGQGLSSGKAISNSSSVVNENNQLVKAQN